MVFHFHHTSSCRIFHKLFVQSFRVLQCMQVAEFTVRTESSKYSCLPRSATVSLSFESVF